LLQTLLQDLQKAFVIKSAKISGSVCKLAIFVSGTKKISVVKQLGHQLAVLVMITTHIAVTHHLVAHTMTKINAAKSSATTMAADILSHHTNKAVTPLMANTFQTAQELTTNTAVCSSAAMVAGLTNPKKWAAV
jgi:hypothetical protein